MIGYGNLFGFLFTWTIFLILRPGSEAIKSLTLATYVTEEFFQPNCSNENSTGKASQWIYMNRKFLQQNLIWE